MVNHESLVDLEVSSPDRSSLCLARNPIKMNRPKSHVFIVVRDEGVMVYHESLIDLESNSPDQQVFN